MKARTLQEKTVLKLQYTVPVLKDQYLITKYHFNIKT